MRALRISEWELSAYPFHTQGTERSSAKTAHRGELATGEVGSGLRPAAILRQAEAAEAPRRAAAAVQLPRAGAAAARAAEEEFPPAAVPPG
jgi:hypothetical protein